MPLDPCPRCQEPHYDPRTGRCYERQTHEPCDGEGCSDPACNGDGWIEQGCELDEIEDTADANGAPWA